MEYLFRAKRKDNGGWVYGHIHSVVGKGQLSKMTYKYPYHEYEEIDLDLHYILCPHLPTDVGWSIEDTYIDYQVKPETIGQLHNRLSLLAGTNVFVGDIISYDLLEGLGEPRVKGLKQVVNSIEVLTEYHTNVKLIGNIYDNLDKLNKC